MWHHEPEDNLSVDSTTGESLRFRGTSPSGQMLFEYHAGDHRLPVAVMADDVTVVGLRRWTLDYDWVVRDWGGGFHEDVPAHIEPASWWPARAIWERADDALESALLSWPGTVETGPAPVFLKRLGGYLGYGWSPWLARFTLPPQQEVQGPTTPLRHLLGEDVPPWGEPDWITPYLRRLDPDGYPNEIYWAEFLAGKLPSLVPEIDAYAVAPEKPPTWWRPPLGKRAGEASYPIVGAVSTRGERILRYRFGPRGHRGDRYPAQPFYYEDGAGLRYLCHDFPHCTAVAFFACLGLIHCSDPFQPTDHPDWPTTLAEEKGRQYSVGGPPPPEPLWRRADRAIIDYSMNLQFSIPTPDATKEHYKSTSHKVLSVRLWGGYFNSSWTQGSDKFRLLCADGNFMTKEVLRHWKYYQMIPPLFREIVRDLRRMKAFPGEICNER